VSIQPFGAFIELIPGKDGLLHISKMAKGRIAHVESVLNIGDEVEVIVQEIDDRGKVSLDLIEKFDVPEGAEAPPSPRRDDRGHSGGYSGDRDRKPRQRR
jgi:polyribonucleotide nucleotidyltransferase